MGIFTLYTSDACRVPPVAAVRWFTGVAQPTPDEDTAAARLVASAWVPGWKMLRAPGDGGTGRPLAAVIDRPEGGNGDAA